MKSGMGNIVRAHPLPGQSGAGPRDSATLTDSVGGELVEGKEEVYDDLTVQSSVSMENSTATFQVDAEELHVIDASQELMARNTTHTNPGTQSGSPGGGNTRKNSGGDSSGKSLPRPRKLPTEPTLTNKTSTSTKGPPSLTPPRNSRRLPELPKSLGSISERGSYQRNIGRAKSTSPIVATQTELADSSRSGLSLSSQALAGDTESMSRRNRHTVAYKEKVAQGKVYICIYVTCKRFKGEGRKGGFVPL